MRDDILIIPMSFWENSCDVLQFLQRNFKLHPKDSSTSVSDLASNHLYRLLLWCFSKDYTSTYMLYIITRRVHEHKKRTRLVHKVCAANTVLYRWCWDVSFTHHMQTLNGLYLAVLPLFLAIKRSSERMVPVKPISFSGAHVLRKLEAGRSAPLEARYFTVDQSVFQPPVLYSVTRPRCHLLNFKWIHAHVTYQVKMKAKIKNKCINVWIAGITQIIKIYHQMIVKQTCKINSQIDLLLLGVSC